MSGSAWGRVARWFAARAEHVTVRFLPDAGAAPLVAGEGYVRLWLAEGFLGQRVTWGKEQFPVLQGGLALGFGGRDGTPFASFTRQPDAAAAPGAYLDYPVTPLLPFNGGAVEAQAALYRASAAGPLGGVLAVAARLARLVGPLAQVAAVAEVILAGLDEILSASKDDPVLGVHYALESAGGGGHVLRPGRLVVVDAPPDRLGGTLELDVDGRVRIDGGPLTGVNYLVLRVECRTERDDWRIPELDGLIRAARTARIEGDTAAFERRAIEARVRIVTYDAFVDADRPRIAQLVNRLLNEDLLGAVPVADLTLDAAAKVWLLPRDAPELAGGYTY